MCCGENGPRDYQRVLSASCCGGQSSCTSVQAYQNGCKRSIEEFLVKNGKIVGGVAIGVAIVEVRCKVMEPQYLTVRISKMTPSEFCLADFNGDLSGLLLQLLGVWFALGLAGAIKKAERSRY